MFGIDEIVLADFSINYLPMYTLIGTFMAYLLMIKDCINSKSRKYLLVQFLLLLHSFCVFFSDYTRVDYDAPLFARSKLGEYSLLIVAIEILIFIYILIRRKKQRNITKIKLD